MQMTPTAAASVESDAVHETNDKGDGCAAVSTLSGSVGGHVYAVRGLSIVWR